MPERINKLQPDRTLYLRGFDTFAAAASIHNASPTGFEISGVFRDPADFAVAVLYDADNAFEHPSIRYLPDFNLEGLTLNFSLLYSDEVQPIDSPKYNWIDWATLDCVREDGSSPSPPISLIDNSMLADAAFPAASATLTVVESGIKLDDRLTLWYQNVAFDYISPGGILGTATYFAETAGTPVSISVGSIHYGYTLAEDQDAPTIAANLASMADADPHVHFFIATPGSNVITFAPKVNTQAVVDVTGYQLWLMTDPVDAFIAKTLADQINNYAWANTLHGLLATIDPVHPNQIVITAAQYGTVNATNATVEWGSGTKFSGVAPGTTFLIGGASYEVASVQSPKQLTLTLPVPTPGGASYLAPRGGRDGNMITLYSLANSPSTLAFDQSHVQLNGGSSFVTWNCSIDFSALGIDRLRQCWLTFAPSLANGAAYTASEWHATFSNWSLTSLPDVRPDPVPQLQIAGPGSVRIEQNYAACTFNRKWPVQAGAYSGYFAAVSNVPGDTVTVTYTCQFTHNLYLGTSLDGTTAAAPGLTVVNDTLYSAPTYNGHLYSDRGVAGVRLDNDAETMLDCRYNTVGSELVTRRLLRTSVAPGKHTVVIRVAEAGFVYFDFLEAAVLSDISDALTPRTNISPALDFDTDQTYKVSPSRLLWMFQKLGYAGPMNEYLGVFWWNQRRPKAGTGSVSTIAVDFAGPLANGDLVTVDFGGGGKLVKTVFPADTPDTVAAHFADYINSSLTGSWASTTAGGVLTITGRSPALPYNLAVTPTLTPVGTSTLVSYPAGYVGPPTGSYPTWEVDDTASSPINRGVADWHADFYSQCHTLGLQVVTACSMELVNPPDGYAALYPDSTPVTTATDFGGLFSTQCAIGSSKMLAYQKAVYRQIAAMQSAAGLTPWVQYGEFLWWYFGGASGMGYYDAETVAASAASGTGLGRALHTFLTPNDDPNAVNGGSDAIFLRNRLRDYVAALVADIRSAYPAVTCEVLWPYDVNYPTPLATVGGQLNRFVNLPVEWQTKSSSGLDRMKVEALAFATGLRNLNLAREAIGLFIAFGWPLSSLTYLVPVFGSATPWVRELSLVRSAGIPTANLWALDHVCLYNLSVPERPLDRRSVTKI
jgi:hypothetical protein